MSSEQRKYQEAQQWVSESKALMMQADLAFRANPNDETREALYTAQYAWRRDLDIRMKRADALSDEEYDEVIRLGRN